MTSGLETEWDYSRRMGRDGKARKYMKRVRKAKVKDGIESLEVKG